MSQDMTNRFVWDVLLTAAREAHEQHPDVSAFCPFPDDLRRQEVQAQALPPAALMAQEAGLFTDRYAALRDAFIAAGPQAQWRESYREADIGADFLTRFGCYCLIGEGGAFASDRMAAWVVYMPAQLYYPWHHHPAEEIYLTLAGEAEFMRAGMENRMLGPGETSLHQSNQPHAMRTHDEPVMAYVVWRNGFDTPPVLTGIPR